MTRFCFSFLAGSLLTCAGIMLADSRTGIMFIAGGVALLILQAGLIASVSRARSFCRFILSVCDALDSRRAGTRQIAFKREVEPHALSARAGSRPSTQQDQVAAALRNLGMNRKKAGVAASEAGEGGGSLQEIYRRATGAPEGEDDPLDDLFGPRKREVA